MLSMTVSRSEVVQNCVSLLQAFGNGGSGVLASWLRVAGSNQDVRESGHPQRVVRRTGIDM
jgi:hypothetical protein